jgi:hypothetical protein
VSAFLAIATSTIACGGSSGSDTGLSTDSAEAQARSTHLVPGRFHCQQSFEVRTKAGPSIEVASAGQVATAQLDSRHHADLGQFLSEEPGESFEVVIDSKVFGGESGTMDLIFHAEEGTDDTKLACSLVRHD